MDKIIILVFILLLCVLVYLNFNKFYESFSNKTFVLVDSKRGAEIIYSIDTFNKYNKHDRLLRNIGDDDNITSHYINKLDDWTDYERKIVNWLCEGIETKIPSEYKFLIKNIEIVKFKKGVEMDFPHTNLSAIFLSKRFIDMIIPFFNNNNLDKCIENIGSIIVHETVHIWQRRDPKFFYGLYKKWKFKKYEKIINSKKFKNVNRYNPDGVDLNWCFYDDKNDNEYLLLSTYKDTAKNISHVNLVGIEVEKLGSIPIIPPLPNIQKLDDIDYFVDFFGNVGGNNYHPNELAAEIISIHVIGKMNLVKTIRNKSPAELIYSSHFNQEYLNR